LGPAPTYVPLVEAKKIMQPFGDRSKVVIEPMLTDQWFVDTAKIVEPALEAVRTGRTKIIPPSGEKTYYHWLENIEPWCISRQLWWGHQIPVWYGPEIDEAGRPTLTSLKSFCAPSAEEAMAMARQFYPREITVRLGDGTTLSDRENWYENASPELKKVLRDRWGLGPEGAKRKQPFGGIKAYSVDGERKIEVIIDRDPDVLDTWFSSGLWPIGTLGWPEPTPELQKYFPTSVLVTGQDILFFWVARMMMMQLAVVNDIPFHTVYLHGLVRDAKGKKMSKSLGNVIDPLEIIDEYGADALRFANAAMATLGGVLKLDTNRIAGYRNFGTKIWNAFRFAEMNGVFALPPQAPPAPKATASRWILGETLRVRAAVDEALSAFRFNDAANALYAFVWGKVCDWYIEFAKPLLAKPETAAETRATMRFVLDRCLILLHPFMPFLTEALWQETGPRAKLCAHADWPEAEGQSDEAADREMGWAIGLIDDIRSARAQLRVPVGLKLPMLATAMDAEARRAWEANAALIQRLAHLESLTEAASAPKGAIHVAAEGAAFAIPLEGAIDLAAETARLKKTLDKLGKDAAGLKGRLSNPKFVESAPEEVVEETRETLASTEAEAQKLAQALARLADGA
jgi:valyl-tRNA synthetase